jgi:hypothetical protein
MCDNTLFVCKGCNHTLGQLSFLDPSFYHPPCRLPISQGTCDSQPPPDAGTTALVPSLVLSSTCKYSANFIGLRKKKKILGPSLNIARKSMAADQDNYDAAATEDDGGSFQYGMAWPLYRHPTRSTCSRMV